ncbi:hypothetical protein M3Y98_00167000 [Aphelenchoides besseyi]|nr:hypothetical protein M3Y98_00167000 [Aphelenchoides besseyi]KAI6199966.1 hypothetical protein M3Y96_00683200 [Aphelenchoides besseyi]
MNRPLSVIISVSFHLIVTSTLLTTPDPLACTCDTETTIRVGSGCLLASHNDSNQKFDSGCVCQVGFSNLKLQDGESKIVSCVSRNSGEFPVSVRCFCDGRSSFTDKTICIATMENEQQITYETGCRCAYPYAEPQIVSEYFLSRIYVVRCVANLPSFDQLTSASTSSAPNFINEVTKMRRKRDVSTSSVSSTTESSTLSTSSDISTSSQTTVNQTESTGSYSLTSSSISSTNSTTQTSTTHSTTKDVLTTLQIQTSTELTTTVQETLTTEEQDTTRLFITEELTTDILTNSTNARLSTSTFRSTLTSNLTTRLITTTTPEDDGDINFGACNATSFSKTDKQHAEIMLYFGAAWVILWTIATIIANLFLRIIGHHRFLDFLQEVGIIAVFVFMAHFVLRPDLTDLCKVTTIVLQFFLMYFLLIADMQAIFLNSLIKGRSSKNSCLPWFFNYLIPPLLAGGITTAFYFILKDQYENNGVHCFCEIYSELYWTFIFPAWVFGFFALLVNQTAITACKMSRSNVRPDQKSCRGMPILATFFCLCFFCLLFGIDMQRLWLIGVYLGVCILFGPLIFILHTYCYEKGSIRLFAKTGLNFYKPCQLKKNVTVENEASKVDLRTKHPLTDPIVSRDNLKETADLPPQPISGIAVNNPPLESYNAGVGKSTTDLDYMPTRPQELYDWLVTDPNAQNVDDVENVLFKKNV